MLKNCKYFAEPESFEGEIGFLEMVDEFIEAHGLQEYRLNVQRYMQSQMKISRKKFQEGLQALRLRYDDKDTEGYKTLVDSTMDYFLSSVNRLNNAAKIEYNNIN